MSEASSLPFTHLLIGFVLGSPVLLIFWALYRMRAAAALTPSPSNLAAPQAAGRSISQNLVLANYAAAVQASNLRQGKAFPLVPFLVMFELVQLYTALYLLVVWRSAPYWIGWVLLAAFALVVYRFGAARLQPRSGNHPLVAVHEAMPAPLQSAWGLLGHALLWGSFCLIFICIILREYYL